MRVSNVLPIRLFFPGYCVAVLRYSIASRGNARGGSDCTVLLSDVIFLDGSWLDALQMLADLHPLVAALVVADPVDHPFLKGAYSRGACGVIWKPIDLSEAIHLIRAAHEASIDRASVREALMEPALC
jgi:DNA-binding NarL/FixJ family response regulator